MSKLNWISKGGVIPRYTTNEFINKFGNLNNRNGLTWLSTDGVIPRYTVNEFINKLNYENDEILRRVEMRNNLDLFKYKKTDYNLLTENTNNEEKSCSKKKSCCYITSACLDYLGISRDAPEMKAMKILTKEYVLKSYSGKKDYIRYGKVAPGIVEKIMSCANSKKIWNDVYTNLKKVSDFVFSGKYEEGHREYKNLVIGLERLVNANN